MFAGRGREEDKMGTGRGESREFQKKPHKEILRREGEAKELGGSADFTQVRQKLPKEVWSNLPQPTVEQPLVVNIYSTDVFFCKTLDGK